MKTRMRPSKKVLLCDRDQAIQGLYQRELKQEGHEVVCAASVAEMLRLVRAEHPDLVLLEDGIGATGNGETIGRILEEDNALPVVIISGHNPLGEDFSVWLANAWVVKSKDVTELKTVIRKVLLANAQALARKERTQDVKMMKEADHVACR